MCVKYEEFTHNITLLTFHGKVTITIIVKFIKCVSFKNLSNCEIEFL